MKEVVQGEREKFPLKLVTKNDTKEPTTENIDLSNANGATSKVCFRAGVTIEKTFDSPDVDLTDAEKGELTVTLQVADTDLFTANDIGDIEVLIDNGSGDVTKIQILRAFQVVAKICD